MSFVEHAWTMVLIEEEVISPGGGSGIDGNFSNGWGGLDKGAFWSLGADFATRR